ncbi:MAG TPA: hypothetical protein VNT58_12510 [Gaiellaceae bacterium]|nr:hypothetical protein [Gaiellaceae bacterium]
MPLYDRVKDLPLTIERVEHEQRALPLAHMTRRTTVFRLHGAGEEGVGEDVTYEGPHHEAVALPELAGTHTLDLFSQLVADAPGYRRWGLESAALDLALRQAGLSLGEAVEREPQPVRFVVSQNNARDWLAVEPGLRFKLDASDSWTDAVVAELAATGAVDVVDLKGLYEGEWVDATPSPELYARVAAAFPHAWLEDARLTDETRPVLEPHLDRLTWDFPIHSVADVDALEHPPRCLNSKPSRFGSVRNLFDFYDACFERGIEIYGGGQFELGPGRGQIQHLASLFHPDAPNDVAPGVYNEGGPRSGLPQSPLPPASRDAGFR